MKTTTRDFFAVLAVVLLCGACTATSAYLKNYGSFEPDSAVTQAFETHQINPDLNYYISGSDVYPNAIMGLNKDYTLEPSLWKKEHMTPKKLKDMVEAMHKRASEMGMHVQGWSMRDAGGRTIGVWYSDSDATTFLKVEGNNMVSVARPPQNIFEDHSDND